MTKGNGKSYGVTLQPQTYQGMLRGVQTLVSAVRPTLGPHARMVALATEMSQSRSPELLDDGGTLARRIIQLPDRDADIGAMYLRNLLWQMREDYGDGTATLAVLFEAVVSQSLRYIVNGGNAVQMRTSLEKGARLVKQALEQMTVPVLGRDQLAQIAVSVCADPDIAAALCEIFDTIGEYGHLELRKGNGRGLETEYVQGAFWKGELHFQSQATLPGERKAELEDCAVLVTDFMVEDMHHLVPVIRAAKQAGATSLFLLCAGITEACVGFLNSAQTRAVLPVIAAKMPGITADEQIAAMEDITILTGGVPMTRNAGESLESVRTENFGGARNAWANDQHLGISGGQGNTRRLREHLRVLKTRHAAADSGGERDLLRQRIGKLVGGSAVLWVGGATDAEMTVRQDMAERAAEALRGAMMRGVLPGGGMALLACRPALKQAAEQAETQEEKIAYRILISAMEAPLRAILCNAGHNPDEVLALIKVTEGARGFDVRKNALVTCGQAGAPESASILDAASVVQAAAYRAITGAALLLTVDVLLKHRNPETVTNT